MFVNEKQKEIANSVDMVDYLLAIGEPLKKEGNYYRHIHHDSLVINGKRNYFSWNSKGISGNTITYLMHLHELSFQEAVLKINKDLGHYEIKSFKPDKEKYLDKFIYNINEVKQTSAIEEYLVKERCIDPEIVQFMIENDYIRQDSYKNIVFKWKNFNNETIGASLQGTLVIPVEKRLNPDRAYFKKVLPNIEENTYEGFNIVIGKPKKIYMFESSIDLLSYMSLYKKSLNNCLLKSMDGLKHETVLKSILSTSKYLKKQGLDLEKITLCVDNDEAGRNFVKKLSGIKYKRKDGQSIGIVSHLPKKPLDREKWDWNNALKKKKIDRRIEHGSICL